MTVKITKPTKALPRDQYVLMVALVLGITQDLGRKLELQLLDIKKRNNPTSLEDLTTPGLY